ncbi:hypothetical protein Mmc1_0904 [Magnetococcus marinus MC-1]|uniref:Uncharacterized protein n=1 Tax=Magnetococcus marinus (strain ATCC BAA-1437 / JCM 17883 / MC-1) TaxID=156889 RepID=A0L630_MAGMM|nr:hypothetical protein [Magnetococcus marinus]ABK43423.1 hypothetical protein Mmc1_0904 [Magnetococcus marinus MC-1]
MSIRRVDKPGASVSTTATRRTGQRGAVSGAKFTEALDSAQVAAVNGIDEVNAAEAVEQVEQISDQTKHRQLKQADEVLDSLCALEKELHNSAAQGDDGVMERLRETRDEALRNLTEETRGGEERELLHRTAVLATVELAKKDRGDYH